jgi:hypothetical protein
LVRSADGKLYAVGSARFGGTDTRFYVERFLPDGAPDAGFGDGGAALVDFPGSLLDEARSAVLQPDGKLIVAGFVRNAQGVSIRRSLDCSLKGRQRAQLTRRSLRPVAWWTRASSNQAPRARPRRSPQRW